MPSTVGIVASGVVDFTPLSLLPALWLDASDTSTITASSGAVSQWNDKSGNGRHVSQATSARQPTTGSVTINGKNALSFDGGDSLTYDAGSDAINLNPLTFAIVAYDNNSPQTSGSYDRIFSARRSSTATDDYQSPNLVISKDHLSRQIAYAANGFGSSYVTYSNQTTFLVTGVATSSSAEIALNAGSFTSLAGNAAMGLMRYLRVASMSPKAGNPPDIIATEQWVGRIAEIVLVSATLSTSNMASLRSYLLTKWGL